MKKALVYLILCCTALPAGAQTLTLDECRAAAAEHNRTLRDGRFELEAALQTRREALTGYFPQVSAMEAFSRPSTDWCRPISA